MPAGIMLFVGAVVVADRRRSRSGRDRTWPTSIEPVAGGVVGNVPLLVSTTLTSGMVSRLPPHDRSAVDGEAGIAADGAGFA